tara:strand:+ start:50 stop:547 length:498 start_codon:yes stop_codon:yes gene_type:complete
MKKTNSKIIPNFLKAKDFASLQKIMMATHFPWFYKGELNGSSKKSDLDSYFTHSFFIDNNVNSNYFSILAPLIKAVKVKALLRVVGNLYYKTDKIVVHPFHVDFPFKHKGALLSLNTCNGATFLKNNEKIKSVRNQMLFFDSSEHHASTSTTDQKARFNILFNYF